MRAKASKALWIAAALTACGYRPVRSDRVFGHERVSITAFAELEPVGVSAEIARYLAELTAQGGVAVVATGADAELRGVVRASRTNPLPIADPRPGATIAGYQVSIEVEAELVDARGKVLWKSTVAASEDFVPALSRDETSPVAVLETESSRRRALDRLAQRAAREIYDRLLMSGS